MRFKTCCLEVRTGARRKACGPPQLSPRVAVAQHVGQLQSRLVQEGPQVLVAVGPQLGNDLRPRFPTWLRMFSSTICCD